MRTKLFIIALLSVVTVLAHAQQQEWQSTSAMRGAGSAYSPQVTAVGATSVSNSATTTESNYPGLPGGRVVHGFDTGGDTPPGPSPVGDAVLPLMALGLAYAVYRRKRRAVNE